MIDENTKKLHETELKLYQAEADRKFILTRYGDTLAEREGYKTHKV